MLRSVASRGGILTLIFSEGKIKSPSNKYRCLTGKSKSVSLSSVLKGKKVIIFGFKFSTPSLCLDTKNILKILKSPTKKFSQNVYEV